MPELKSSNQPNNLGMIRIAVDGMGGDNAPKVVCEGVLSALRQSQGQFEVILTGPQDVLAKELGAAPELGSSLHIHHSPELVAMDESPAEVLKTKRNSSLVECVTLQKIGKADASVSAGNSGAMMAACLMILGRVGNVSRPAIACNIPLRGRKMVLLDCGANVDEKPIQLLHHGICGSVYAQYVLGVKNPKVGLLNVGEEEKKGPESIQEAHQLFKKSNLNFIGNVEGRDILTGETDVIVTPGYTGNVILKLMEGFYEMHQNLFGTIDSEAGRWFANDWNYSNTGGAMLLGLSGTGIITHGRADAAAIAGAVWTANQMASSTLYQKIAQQLEGIV